MAVLRVYLGLLLLLLLCVLCVQVCVCFCVGRVCCVGERPGLGSDPRFDARNDDVSSV